MDKIFSGQFGEVLILKNIINKFPIPKTCIEFGAYDGITNANTFSLRSSILLRIKKIFFQLTLEINYSLRGKSIPSHKIPEDCKKRIVDTGLYV